MARGTGRGAGAPPSGDWWQDERGKWQKGPRPSLEEAADERTLAAPPPIQSVVQPTATPQIDEQNVRPADFDKLKGRVKKALGENLAADETIRVIIHGAFGQAMIGTDTRVFVCKPGFMAGAAFGAEVTSWSYVNLVGVQAHKGLTTGSVVLQAPGQTGKRTSYWGGKDEDPAKAPNAIPIAGDWKQVQTGVARLRQLIDRAHTPAAPLPGAAPAPPSTADELRKLADLHGDGVLTDAEFQAAKARLLEQ